MKLFPFSNLHELNLDWILNKIKDLETHIAQSTKVRKNGSHLDITDETTGKPLDGNIDTITLNEAVLPIADATARNDISDIMTGEASVANAITADRATADMSGNDIEDTYATKEEIGNVGNIRNSAGTGAVQTVHRHDKDEFTGLDGIDYTLTDDELANGDESVVLNGYGYIEDGSKLSTVVGNKNVIKGDSSGAFICGDTNLIDGGSYGFVAGFGNELNSSSYCAMFGGDNKIDDGAVRSIVTGASNEIKSGTKYTLVTGSENDVEASENCIVGGAYHNVENSENSIIVGLPDNTGYVQAVNSVIAGKNNSYSGNTTYKNTDIIVAGQSNTIDRLSDGIVVGSGNDLTGTGAKNDDSIIGSGNTLAGGNNNIIVGRNNNGGTVYNSQTLGEGLTASTNRVTIGRYNNDSPYYTSAEVVIGNGTDANNKHNAVEITNNLIKCFDTVEVPSTPNNNNSAATVGYVKSRIGAFGIIKILGQGTPATYTWTVEGGKTWDDLVAWATGQDNTTDYRMYYYTGGSGLHSYTKVEYFPALYKIYYYDAFNSVLVILNADGTCEIQE